MTRVLSALVLLPVGAPVAVRAADIPAPPPWGSPGTAASPGSVVIYWQRLTGADCPMCRPP